MDAPTTHDPTAAARNWPDEIYDLLARRNVRHASYVPDAGHSGLISRFVSDPAATANVLTTEEEGIAIAVSVVERDEADAVRHAGGFHRFDLRVERFAAAAPVGIAENGCDPGLGGGRFGAFGPGCAGRFNGRRGGFDHFGLGCF